MKKKLMMAVFSLALLGGMKTTEAKFGDRLKNLDGHRLVQWAEKAKEIIANLQAGLRKAEDAAHKAKQMTEEAKVVVSDIRDIVDDIAETDPALAAKINQGLDKADKALGVVGDHAQHAEDLAESAHKIEDVVTRGVTQAQEGEYKSAVYTLDDALRSGQSAEPTVAPESTELETQEALPSYEETVGAPPAYTP